MNQSYFPNDNYSSSSSENSMEDPHNINFLSEEPMQKMTEMINAAPGGSEEIQVTTFQQMQIEKTTKGSHENIRIKFGHNVAEGLKQVRETLTKERDVKSISIVFYDQKLQKTIKIRVSNEKNQAQKNLVSKMIKKGICKSSFSPLSGLHGAGIQKMGSFHNHKNGPKLLGKAMIDYFYDKENEPVLEKCIQQNKKNPKSKKPTINDIHDWIQAHRLTDVFNKIQTFREIWSLADNGDSLEDIKAKVFREVCHHFLTNEAERFIFSRFCGNSSKEMKLENAIAYLGLLPKFIKGVLDPRNFLSFK